MGLARRTAILWLGLALALLSPAAALAQENGVVAIAVQNGTAGAAVPAEVEIELLGFEAEVLAATWRDLPRDERGRLLAAGLDTDPSWTYVATATHKGLTFASPPIGFADGPEAQTVLEIFEPAPSDPGAVLTEYTLVLAREAGGARIRAVHTVAFELPGDRALAIAPPDALLRFPLPPAATAVAALAGPASWEVGADAGELLGAATLPPGESTFSFEYQFPWDRAGQDLAVVMPAPTERFRVWGVESQVRIAAPALVEQPGLQMNERARLAIYEGRDFAAGESAGLRISDPGYGFGDRLGTGLETRPAALVAVALGLLPVALAVAVRVRQRRRRLAEARALLDRAAADPGEGSARDRLAVLLADDPDLAARLRDRAAP